MTTPSEAELARVVQYLEDGGDCLELPRHAFSFDRVVRIRSAFAANAGCIRIEFCGTKGGNWWRLECPCCGLVVFLPSTPFVARHVIRRLADQTALDFWWIPVSEAMIGRRVLPHGTC